MVNGGLGEPLRTLLAEPQSQIHSCSLWERDLPFMAIGGQIRHNPAWERARRKNRHGNRLT